LAVSPTSPILDGVNTIILTVLLVEELLSRRGNSAGWGHHRGSGQYSAEATALAALAGWQDLDPPARTSILDYWKSHQLPDGGWSSIAPSSSGGNWPTAIIANTLTQVAPKHPCLPKALRSLVSAEPGEAFWLWRLKFRTADTNVRFDPSKYGLGLGFRQCQLGHPDRWSDPRFGTRPAPGTHPGQGSRAVTKISGGR